MHELCMAHMGCSCMHSGIWCISCCIRHSLSLLCVFYDNDTDLALTFFFLVSNASCMALNKTLSLGNDMLMRKKTILTTASGF